MVELFTIDFVLTFLVGVAIGFFIGVIIILLRERSEKRLLNYLLEVYAQKEEESLPDPKKTGLTDEEKAKYLRAVLKSIEKEDERIRKRKRRSKVENDE